MQAFCTKLTQKQLEIAVFIRIFPRATYRQLGELAGTTLEQAWRTARELERKGLITRLDPVRFKVNPIINELLKENPRLDLKVRRVQAAGLQALPSQQVTVQPDKVNIVQHESE